MTRRSPSPWWCIAFLALAACGEPPEGGGVVFHKNKFPFVYYKACIEGVTYIQADRSVSVQFTRDGKVVPCDE